MGRTHNLGQEEIVAEDIAHGLLAADRHRKFVSKHSLNGSFAAPNRRDTTVYAPLSLTYRHPYRDARISTDPAKTRDT